MLKNFPSQMIMYPSEAGVENNLVSGILAPGRVKNFTEVIFHDDR
jgi:hypothetical protein